MAVARRGLTARAHPQHAVHKLRHVHGRPVVCTSGVGAPQLRGWVRLATGLAATPLAAWAAGRISALTTRTGVPGVLAL